jgi:hypothetical protein
MVCHLASQVRNEFTEPTLEMRSALETDDPYATAFDALEALFLKAQGKEWRGRYSVAVSKVKPVEGGDAIAIARYANLIQEHVKNLNSLIETHGELLRPIARQSLAWPVRIGRRKPFGDDSDEIISKLQVGADTIAKDSNARFNPKGKFGRIAVDVLERIEHARSSPKFTAFETALRKSTETWQNFAATLPPFSVKPTSDEKQNWLKSVRQVLESDFRDLDRASSYLSLLDKPSYKKRRHRKAAFFDKICSEFETLWGSRR